MFVFIYLFLLLIRHVSKEYNFQKRIICANHHSLIFLQESPSIFTPIAPYRRLRHIFLVLSPSSCLTGYLLKSSIICSDPFWLCVYFKSVFPLSIFVIFVIPQICFMFPLSIVCNLFPYTTEVFNS